MQPFLRQHQLIATSDADQMEAILKRTFDTRRFDLASARGTFAAAASHRQFDDGVGLTYCSYDADVEVEFPESNLVRVYMGFAGRAEHITRSGEGRLQEGSNLIIGPNVAVRSRFQSGIRQLVLRLERASLCRTLEGLTGRHISEPVEFLSEPSETLQPARRLIEILAQHLDQPSSSASKLFERELVQAAVVALLTNVPHNFTALLARPERAVTRSKVERAEAFMDANWDKPLCIEAIALEVGCSVRSLFKSFQTERGYTPILFLRRKRLERAHGMLLNRETFTSIADIAVTCGFSNAGHFARYYREQYGVLPSFTLRIGRVQH